MDDPGLFLTVLHRTRSMGRTAVQLFVRRFGSSTLETVLRLVPSLLCLLAIFHGSSLEASQIPSFAPPALGHLFEYLALGLSLAIAAAGFTHTRVSAWGYFVAWSFAMTWALSDEWHQSFVPGRVPSTEDLLVDAIGAAAGLLMAFIIASKGESVA